MQRNVQCRVLVLVMVVVMVVVVVVVAVVLVQKSLGRLRGSAHHVGGVVLVGEVGALGHHHPLQLIMTGSDVIIC